MAILLIPWLLQSYRLLLAAAFNCGLVVLVTNKVLPGGPGGAFQAPRDNEEITSGNLVNCPLDIHVEDIVRRGLASKRSTIQGMQIVHNDQGSWR